LITSQVSGHGFSADVFFKCINYIYAMSQNMALNFCLYFCPDIGNERILQISQTCDRGRQFALKFFSCLK